MVIKIKLTGLRALVNGPPKVSISAKEWNVKKHIPVDEEFTPEYILRSIIIGSGSKVPKDISGKYGPELGDINGTLANLASKGILETIEKGEYRVKPYMPQTEPVEVVPSNGNPTQGPNIEDLLEGPVLMNGRIPEDIVIEPSKLTHTKEEVFDYVKRHLGQTYVESKGRIDYSIQDIKEVVRSYVPEEEVPNMLQYLIDNKSELRWRAGLPPNSNLFYDDPTKDIYQNNNGTSKSKNDAQKGQQPDDLGATVEQQSRPAANGQPEIPQNIYFASVRLSRIGPLLEILAVTGELRIDKNFHYGTARGSDAALEIGSDLRRVLNFIYTMAEGDTRPQISKNGSAGGSMTLRIDDNPTRQALEGFTRGSYNMERPGS